MWAFACPAVWACSSGSAGQPPPLGRALRAGAGARGGSPGGGARAGGAAAVRGARAGAARRGQVHAHPLPGPPLHAPGADARARPDHGRRRQVAPADLRGVPPGASPRPRRLSLPSGACLQRWRATPRPPGSPWRQADPGRAGGRAARAPAAPPRSGAVGWEARAPGECPGLGLGRARAEPGGHGGRGQVRGPGAAACRRRIRVRDGDVRVPEHPAGAPTARFLRAARAACGVAGRCAIPQSGAAQRPAPPWCIPPRRRRCALRGQARTAASQCRAHVAVGPVAQRHSRASAGRPSGRRAGGGRERGEARVR